MSLSHNKAWAMVKMLLLASRRHATAECGFSINKEIVIENQQVQSLVARGVIRDHIDSDRGIENAEVSHVMIMSGLGI
jgi:hypothetical protein